MSTLSIGIDRYWSAHLSFLSNEIDPDMHMGRFYWMKLFLIGSWVDFLDCDRPSSAHLPTMSTAIYPIPLTCRLGRLWLTLIRSCADSVYCDRLWLYLMPTLSTVIKPLLLTCRLCRLRYTLILSCVDSVDCDWHWLELVPTLSTVIDPPKLIFWLCWLRSTAMAQVSTLLADMERDCSCVDSVDCDWSWLAQVLILSNVIDPVWLMCRFCRLRLTLILSCADWHWLALVTNF